MQEADRKSVLVTKEGHGLLCWENSLDQHLDQFYAAQQTEELLADHNINTTVNHPIIPVL